MKPIFDRKTLVLAVAAAQFVILDTVAFAQPMLEEVIITARKREETLMDAPLAVTAVGGEAMNKEGITNMEQLSSKVPGLQVGRTAQGTNVAIRGIGSGINKAFEQSAGMYVDGIYQSRGRQFTQSLVDLQRVEVLRGPQGTLFGKNTIAGAIKVETATSLPGEELNGSLTMDYEPDQSTGRGTAVIAGSPTDSLGARFAVRYQESDGYVKNNTFNRDEAQKEDTMMRLSLAWDATDNLRLVGKLSYTDMESDGIEVVTPVVDESILGDFFAGNSALALTSVMGTIAALEAPGYQASTGSKEYDTWNGNTGYNDGDFETTESTAASLRFDWELGDYTITGLTGYSDFDFNQNHDVDFHGGNVVHDLDGETLELFSQELRLASNFDGRFNFVLGMYYEEQELETFTDVFIDGSLGGVFGQLPANALNPNFPAVPLAALGINSVWNGAVLAPGTPLAGTEMISIIRSPEFDQESETKAVFAEVSYDLTDSLTMDFGVRYSEDTKDVRKSVTLGTGTPDDRITAINADGSATGDLDPLSTALLRAIWGGPFNTHPHDQDLTRSEEHFDPAVRLRWEATDDTMVYLSWSQGYKSGGFNFSPDTANPDGSVGDDTEFEDEAAEAWELGVKSTVWDGRARLSAILFNTTIEDLQVTSFEGVTFKVGNAAEVTVQGVELETQVAVSDRLEIGGALTFLDHEYDSYKGAPCTIRQQSDGCSAQDLSGKRGAFAPEWSGTMYVDYTREVFSNWLLNARMDLAYKGDFFTEGSLDQAGQQDAYTKINGRLGMSTLDGKWDFAVYGRNLTDEATITSSLGAPLSGGIMASWIEEPRVVGVQVGYNF